MAHLKARGSALFWEMAPLSVWAGLAVIVVLLGSVDLAVRAGLIIGNNTDSVPPGLYRAAPPETATFVTFCLGARHRHLGFYDRFCSPDDPDGDRILKRLSGHPVDGQVLVLGDGPRAIDSDLVGPIQLEEIAGWWRPIVQTGARAEARLAGGAR